MRIFALGAGQAEEPPLTVSLLDDIANRQLENGALCCERYTLDLQPVLHPDRRNSGFRPFIWTAPEWDRHLDGGLFLKLDKVCQDLTGLDRYVTLIIFLMVETGLRVEELCAARWDGVSFEKRRMDVPKPRWSEEHQDRTIVLSVRARMYLEELALALKEDDRFDLAAPIIPLKVPDIYRVMNKVVNWAQVELGEPLWEALHTEAEARMKEARLTRTERDIMLGSALRVLAGSQTELASIQDKLDWQLLDGRTYEEAKNSIPMMSAESVIWCRKYFAKIGALRIPEASPDIIRHFPNVCLRILIP